MLYTHRSPVKNEVEWLNENKIKWETWADTHNYDRSPAYFFKLYKILKREKPDVAEFQVLSAPFGLILSKVLNIKRTIIWHHTLADRKSMGNIQSMRFAVQDFRQRIYFNMASVVVANSIATKNEIITFNKIKPEKISVQYLGTHLAEKINGSVREDYSIVCVGRLMHQKGQHVLISILPEIIKLYPEAKAFFIGKGDSTELKNLAKKLNVTDNCIFTGEIDRNEVYKYLSKATVSVFPTLAEAFGMVAIDSLACGAPLIASKTGGLTDIIENNKNGILVEPGNSDQLKDAILKIFQDKKFREQLSINAIQRANFFEINRRAEDYADWIIEGYKQTSN